MGSHVMYVKLLFWCFVRNLLTSDCCGMYLCINFIRLSGVINRFAIVIQVLHPVVSMLLIICYYLCLTYLKYCPLWNQWKCWNLEGFMFIVLSLRTGCLVLMAVLVTRAVLLLTVLSVCLVVVNRLFDNLFSCFIKQVYFFPFGGLPLFLLFGVLTCWQNYCVCKDFLHNICKSHWYTVIFCML